MHRKTRNVDVVFVMVLGEMIRSSSWSVQTKHCHSAVRAGAGSDLIPASDRLCDAQAPHKVLAPLQTGCRVTHRQSSAPLSAWSQSLCEAVQSLGWRTVGGLYAGNRGAFGCR